jgi:hypothetical protein
VVFVIANKSDLSKSVGDQEGMDFARSQDYEWFSTSAMTGAGISEAFTALAGRIATRGDGFLPKRSLPAVSQKKPCC